MPNNPTWGKGALLSAHFDTIQLNRGNRLIKYSPGTIATLAITDNDTAKAKSTVPKITNTQAPM